jgi:C4-dicarboxylate transporter DctQ subunit
MRYYNYVAIPLKYVEESIAVLCMIGIAVLTFAGVASRFFFHYSIAWSEELVRYLFIWGSMFGASIGFKQGAHAGLPLLVGKFPARVQRPMTVAISLATVTFLLIIVYLGIGLVRMGIESGELSPATKIPYWVVNLGLVAALAFCAYRVLEALVESLLSKQEKG